MKKQKWSEKPITWGGYLKLTGVCSVISVLMSLYYCWCKLYEFHPIECIKEAIHDRFGKETDEE